MPAPSAPEILHLCFLPPFVPGSYNQFLDSVLRTNPVLPQAMVSYWDGPPPAENPLGEKLILLTGRGLPIGKRLWRRLPERFRGLRSNGISGRNTLAYAWRVLDLVRRLRPKVIVCYDGTKLGRLLRTVIDWPCRIILAQRGFSYCLDPRDAERLYSLASFDLVWTMTRSSYRFDLERTHLYEPTVRVIPNGINVRAFRPVVSREEQRELRTGFGLPPDAKVVLLLARLVGKKGAHLIVEAWDRVLAKVPNAHLWLVGGGQPAYIERLRETARSLGVAASVQVTGAIPPAQTPTCYRAADLYAFPTLWGEGQARSLLEAMASGLPCVTSDRPEARELYTDDEVAFVSDQNLEGRFIDPIVALLTDDARARTLGQNARKAVVDRFDEVDRNADLQALLAEQLRLVSAPA